MTKAVAEIGFFAELRRLALAGRRALLGAALISFGAAAALSAPAPLLEPGDRLADLARIGPPLVAALLIMLGLLAPPLLLGGTLFSLLGAAYRAAGGAPRGPWRGRLGLFLALWIGLGLIAAAMSRAFGPGTNLSLDGHLAFLLALAEPLLSGLTLEARRAATTFLGMTAGALLWLAIWALAGPELAAVAQGQSRHAQPTRMHRGYGARLATLLALAAPLRLAAAALIALAALAALRLESAAAALALEAVCRLGAALALTAALAVEALVAHRWFWAHHPEDAGAVDAFE